MGKNEANPYCFHALYTLVSKHGNWTYLEDAWPNLDTLQENKVLAGERR
jgi:hypothetical protein